jgi:uncharacterized protein YukE
MSDPLDVTPEELREASRHMSEVSDRMKNVMSSLQGKLSGEGAAWGDDEIGHQFADGGDGYLSQLDRVHTSVDAKTQLLEGYSESMRAAADNFEQSDQA